MSARAIDRALEAAITAGVLPKNAAAPATDERPWPVVLLTALGAWLAALPLLGSVGLMLGDWITRGFGPYLIGVLVLAGALAMLRARELPLFVEQLAVPALLTGAGTLGFGLFRDLPLNAAAAILALIALAFGWAIARPWLRVLLGAGAALMTMLVCLPAEGDIFGLRHWTRVGFAWHACLALWLIAGRVQRRGLNDGSRARTAAALEALAAGWLLTTLAGLAWWSGMTLLVGATLGGGLVGAVGVALAEQAGGIWGGRVLQSLSVLLAAGGAAWIERSWPAVRRPWCGGVAAVLVVLAWFMPALGAVLLALAASAASKRWRLAAVAALAAAWIVGGFYYQLQWPLATKAVVLVAAAVVLGALAWWAAGGWRAAAPRDGAREPSSRIPQVGIALTALVVLAVANFAIWQKEDLIANGRPVYLELAPVDPRSLMQGDFMRLNFRMPAAVEGRLDGLLSATRPRVVASLDGRGVATVQRLEDGRPLGADEILIELTPKGGRWIFVSDAWFFAEGEAKRWEPAEYGEFRVGDDGRALLVGLVGDDLIPL